MDFTVHPMCDFCYRGYAAYGFSTNTKYACAGHVIDDRRGVISVYA